MAQTRRRPTSHAYLLRLWLENGRAPDQPGAWRFSLEEPRTGARRGFADFESLVAFLASQMEAAVANRPEE